MNELLQLYDQYERINLSLLGFKKEVHSNFIQFKTADGPGSFISFSHLDKTSVYTTVRQLVRQADQYNQSLEWKVYASEDPVQLAPTLVEFGFKPMVRESLMVLNVRGYRLRHARYPHIVNIHDPAGIQQVFDILAQVWKVDFSKQKRQLLHLKRTRPDDLQIYVGYQLHQPASCGWVTFNKNSPFGTLWGGSTLPQFRGQGLYRAILELRIRDALERQIPYIAIEASAMSAPIVARSEFVKLSDTTTYLYQPEG